MSHPWIALIAALALLSVPDRVWGGQAFSIPLPELVGPVAFPGDLAGIQVDFDLEREFSDIERVIIILRAVGTPALVQTCTSGQSWIWDDELEAWRQPDLECETKITPIDLIASLEGETTEQHTRTTVGDFRDYALERAGVFQRSFGTFSFDQLKDGRGSLTLWWNLPLSGGGRTSTIVQPPSIEILEAVLLVEGTPAQVKPRKRIVRWRRGW